MRRIWGFKPYFHHGPLHLSERKNIIISQGLRGTQQTFRVKCSTGIEGTEPRICDVGSVNYGSYNLGIFSFLDLGFFFALKRSERSLLNQVTLMVMPHEVTP